MNEEETGQEVGKEIRLSYFKKDQRGKEGDEAKVFEAGEVDQENEVGEAREVKEGDFDQGRAAAEVKG